MKLYWIKRLIADLKRNPKKAQNSLRPDEGGHCCLGRLALLGGGCFRRFNNPDALELVWKGKRTHEHGVLSVAAREYFGLSEDEQSILARTNDECYDWAPVIARLEDFKVEALAAKRWSAATRSVVK